MEFEPSPASLQSHFTGEAVSTWSKTQTAVSGARVQLVALTLTDCEILGRLLNCLCFSFLTYIMGIVLVPMSKGGCKDKMGKCK